MAYNPSKNTQTTVIPSKQETLDKKLAEIDSSGIKQNITLRRLMIKAIFGAR